MEQIHSEIEGLFALIRREFRKFERTTGVEREAIQTELNHLFPQSKRLIRKYQDVLDKERRKPKNEYGRAHHVTDVRNHRKKIRKLYSEYKEHKDRFKKLKEDSKREELLQFAEEIDEGNRIQQIKKNPTSENSLLTNEDVADILFSDVFQIQDENYHLVKKCMDNADIMIDQAGNINESLSRQNEQLEDISHEMDHLSGIIQRAGREIRSFMRGMATDKIVVVACCLCTCICLISVLSFVICKCYVCTFICNMLGNEAIQKCKKIPLLYYGSGNFSSS